METVTRYNNNNLIFKDSKYLYLISYNSVIAKYDKLSDKLTLFKNWDFSSTTTKYLYRFINFYYYDLTTIQNKKALIIEWIKNKKITYKNQ